MHRSWIAFAIVVAVIVVGHDAYMATTGHADVAAAGTLATGHEDRQHPHGDHDASHTGQHERTERNGSVPEHCDPVRVAAPANRVNPPALDTIQVAVLPDPAILMQFASTSRDIVQTPLPHPPDLNRALFQVYRI